jgi:aspartate aminotransferase
LLIVSDEIYEKINYGRVTHFSIASLPGMGERTITVNGFSKGYAMTGWRVGYGVIPAHLMVSVQAANALQTIGLNSIAQYAALAAYRGPQEPVARMVVEYKRRMSILVDGINAIDRLHCRFPDATYYCWVNTSSTGLAAKEFATHCLLSERVLVSSGAHFLGPGGENHNRTSSSLSEETIREGLRRLERAVVRLKQEAPVLNPPE